jgi:hypothetical protein
MRMLELSCGVLDLLTDLKVEQCRLKFHLAAPMEKHNNC